MLYSKQELRMSFSSRATATTKWDQMFYILPRNELLLDVSAYFVLFCSLSLFGYPPPSLSLSIYLSPSTHTRAFLLPLCHSTSHFQSLSLLLSPSLPVLFSFIVLSLTHPGSLLIDLYTSLSLFSHSSYPSICSFPISIYSFLSITPDISLYLPSALPTFLTAEG